MSRRIDIELTSALDDGSWTWRAAGARNPKGVVPGSVLPAGVKVGDELKVEVEQEIDGITILNVVHGRAKAERSLLELLPSEREFQPVVETRAPGGRPRRDDDRRDRRPRRDDGKGGDGRDRRPRPEGDGRGAPRQGGRGDARPDTRGGGRGEGDRRPRRDGDRPRRGPSFTPPPELPQRPKPQRLKPGKAHRNAVLAELPEEQRPIAELTLQGLAAVRQKVRDENQKAVAEGRAAMPEATVMKMAEELLPKLRVAEWRDRAEAARMQLAQLDLRDLRSVVASANDPIVVRDESTRALAAELTSALATKQEQELVLWFGDVDAALAVGRVVRALRLSSNPPKAGVPFPADIAQRLVDSANASLAPMDPAERWIAMLEAAAFSPVRAQIKPLRKPDAITPELLATVTRLAPALPQVAELFEITVDPKTPMPKPLRPGPRPGDKKDARGAKSDAKPEPKPKRDRERKPDQATPADRAAAAEPTDADPKSVPEAEPAETTPVVAETPEVEVGGDDAATDAAAANPVIEQHPDTADATADTDDVADSAPANEPQGSDVAADTPDADTAPADDEPQPAAADTAAVADDTTTAAADTAPADESHASDAAADTADADTAPADDEPQPAAADDTAADADDTATADIASAEESHGSDAAADTPDAAPADDEPQPAAADDTAAVADDTAADIASADESHADTAPADEPQPAAADADDTAPGTAEATPGAAEPEAGVDAAMAELIETAHGDALLAAADEITAETDALDGDHQQLI